MSISAHNILCVVHCVYCNCVYDSLWVYTYGSDSLWLCHSLHVVHCEWDALCIYCVANYMIYSPHEWFTLAMPVCFIMHVSRCVCLPAQSAYWCFSGDMWQNNLIIPKSIFRSWNPLSEMCLLIPWSSRRDDVWDSVPADIWIIISGASTTCKEYSQMLCDIKAKQKRDKTIRIWNLALQGSYLGRAMVTHINGY